MNKKIALAGPSITEIEEEYVLDAVRNGWYETYDIHIKKLERMCERKFCVKHAIATYTGTHALHLATLALGLKPGDEVIVTDQSYIATAFAITYVGAKCVFVDINRDTLCIDPNLIEAAITDKTKAIMLVHFAGMASDMDAIMEIANKYDLRVIEDACQMVGGKWKDKYAGTIGDIGTYSFQGAKIAVGGEGGMFITSDDDLYEKARHFSSFCRNDSISYLWSDALGYNYRISNITAALILAQIERLDELVSIKRNIYEWYHKYFKEVDSIELLNINEGASSNYAYVVGYVTKKSKVSRDELSEKLIEKNIWCRPGYPSMSAMPGYERRFPVVNSETYWHEGIVLPTAMNITKEDVVRVRDSISEICGE